MRQQHGQAAQSAPFVLTTGNKLINHNLSAVSKVTKLGFPNNERVGLSGGITILKAKHRLLGKHRVDDYKRGLLRRDILQRNMGTQVVALTGLIVQYGMAMGKCAPPRSPDHLNARRSRLQPERHRPGAHPSPSQG